MLQEKTTILLVDDNPMITDLLERILKTLAGEQAIECMQVHNGKQAWTAYRNFKIDIVITDYAMPVMNGYELLEKIMDFNPAACVVLLTADHNKELKKEALHAGAKKVLRKPDDLKKILKSVQALMKLF